MNEKKTNSFFEGPNAFENEQRYVMSRTVERVDEHEFERTGVACLEVMVMWGDTVLHVDHLTPPRSYYAGELEQANLHCDFLIPEEKLGCSRAPIVLVDATGQPSVVVGPNATGTVTRRGERARSVSELRKSGDATACLEYSGAMKIALESGTKAAIKIADFTFCVSAVAAGREASAGFVGDHDWTPARYVGASSIAHLGILAVIAFFMPPLNLADAEELSHDQLMLMQQYLHASAEREVELRENEQSKHKEPTGIDQPAGQRAAGAEGAMGKMGAPNVNKRFGIAGPKDTVDVTPARIAAVNEAQNFGMIGMLHTGAGGDPNAPTAPWGADEAIGRDSASALGHMWGDEIGEAGGLNGLGLTGIGEGGGCRSDNGCRGIGLTNVGTVGGGTGHGIGGTPSGLGPHKTAVPKVGLAGRTEVNGRLPPDVIQRVVRQNYGRFRVCYENGLRSNPSLQGRVTARFIIGRDGAVSTSANGGSDMPDQSVVQCVVRAFLGMSFPAPGGVVTVSYPIMFSPE